MTGSDLLRPVKRSKRSGRGYTDGGATTFIIDWPVLILIGLLFGYGLKGTPAGSALKTRAFWSGMFVVLVFAALVYYSYLLSPDWMWMYFARASDLPSWFTGYALILYFFAYAAGFLLKIELGKINKVFPLLLLLAMLAASAAVVIPIKDRYMNVGTMEQYRAGQTTPLNQSPVGKVPGTLSGFLVPLAIGLLVWSRRQKVS